MEPFRHGGELAGELAVCQVRGLVADKAERSGIPESGGATQGQDDFVAGWKLEKFSQTLAHRSNYVLHASLAVGGAQNGGAIGNGFQLSGAPWIAATEASIGWDQFRWNGGQFIRSHWGLLSTVVLERHCSLVSLVHV